MSHPLRFKLPLSIQSPHTPKNQAVPLIAVTLPLAWRHLHHIEGRTWNWNFALVEYNLKNAGWGTCVGTLISNVPPSRAPKTSAPWCIHRWRLAQRRRCLISSQLLMPSHRVSPLHWPTRRSRPVRLVVADAASTQSQKAALANVFASNWHASGGRDRMKILPPMSCFVVCGLQSLMRLRWS
jgi:hypothetical protein